LTENIATFEPTVEAQDAWFNVLIGTVWGTARYNAACTPGYLNNEGGVGTIRSGKSSSYMTSALEFIDILEQWRAAGNFPGYEVTKN
jgi:cyclohexanone monooxygenase